MRAKICMQLMKRLLTFTRTNMHTYICNIIQSQAPFNELCDLCGRNFPFTVRCCIKIFFALSCNLLLLFALVITYATFSHSTHTKIFWQTLLLNTVLYLLCKSQWYHVDHLLTMSFYRQSTRATCTVIYILQ